LQENKGIVYDSDCIDEYLRNPVDIDEGRFENLNEILKLLVEENSKKVLLSQKVTAPWNESESSIDTGIWIMNGTDSLNSPKLTPFIGVVDNVTVTYFDFFNSELKQFPPTPAPSPTPIDFHNGLVLSENLPILYNSSTICSKPKSLIQTFFSASSSSTVSLNSSLYWTSLCPEALHTTGVVGDRPTYSSHLSLHNTYGHQALTTVYNTLTNDKPGESDNMLVLSSSIWTASMYYGGFNGMHVPFSWKGLQESVAHTVRNYALSPMAGTPICGSTIFNMTIQRDNDLCLRWFQFGMLLPIARNSYDG